MLETVRSRVTDAIARGSALEQVMDAGYTAEFDAGRGGRSAGRRFVRILYLGLSRQ